jgi:hypothetical protein
VERETFWQIVELARAEVDDPVAEADEVAEAVTDRLAALPLDEIVEFELVLDQVQADSYRWDLWAAAYLINDGCSDDSFEDFRGWLVAQGREVWEAAVADPDSLAGIITPDLVEEDATWSEDMLGAAAEAFERVTGDDEAFYDALESAQEEEEPAGPVEPAGESFDFDDPAEMRARLPRLFAIFGEAES